MKAKFMNINMDVSNFCLVDKDKHKRDYARNINCQGIREKRCLYYAWP